MQRPPMLVLFDHGTPRSIARWLQGHVVVEAIARGWGRLANGALLKAAEEAGFDLLKYSVTEGKSALNRLHRRLRRLALVATRCGTD